MCHLVGKNDHLIESYWI